LLDSGLNRGSILPESGTFLLAWNDARNEQRLCSAYFPAGYQKSSNLEPVVLWSNSPGVEGRFAGRVGKLYEYEEGPVAPSPAGPNEFPVYLVPHRSHGNTLSPAEEISDLDFFLQWVKEYFQVTEVALAGVDSAAGAVLKLAHQQPSTLSRVLIFAGANLEPWPQADIQEITAKLTPMPDGFPAITWLDFVNGTAFSGQGKLLLSVLQDAGYNLEPVQKVRGGLSLPQISDRLVLWANQSRKNQSRE
jgi:hypothetical protein